MTNILSIQSSVVYGHVGNSAAVFPLQRLGCEVWPIDTVQFSNHPGHGAWTGQVFPGRATSDLVDGLAARGVLGRVDAVLSGYVGDVATAEAIVDAVGRVRAANGRALYACDPVIGDDGPGIYVRPGIAVHFRDRAVPEADILTPNRFELALLADGADARASIAALRARMRPGGPRIVLVTSVRDPSAPADTVDLLAASDAGLHRVRTPLLPIAVNGAGDLVAATFLHHLLRTGDAAASLGLAASAVFGVVERTFRHGARELELIAAQDEIVAPTRIFVPEPC